MINRTLSLCWHCNADAKIRSYRECLLAPKTYQVVCSDCRTAGPLSSGKIMAVVAWNDMCERIKGERAPF